MMKAIHKFDIAINWEGRQILLPMFAIGPHRLWKRLPE
jgi:hypothetical protein